MNGVIGILTRVDPPGFLAWALLVVLGLAAVFSCTVDYQAADEPFSAERCYVYFCVVCALHSVVGRLGMNGFGSWRGGNDDGGVVGSVLRFLTSMPVVHGAWVCWFCVLRAVISTVFVNVPLPRMP